jgi:hypothetical protein
MICARRGQKVEAGTKLEKQRRERGGRGAGRRGSTVTS